MDERKTKLLSGFPLFSTTSIRPKNVIETIEIIDDSHHLDVDSTGIDIFLSCHGHKFLNLGLMSFATKNGNSPGVYESKKGGAVPESRDITNSSSRGPWYPNLPSGNLI